MINSKQDQSKYKVFYKFSIMSVLITMTLFLMGWTGRSGFDTQCSCDRTDCVVLITKDFSPQDGTWDLNWPGPPRRKVTFSDVERYIVDMRLDRPAPKTFSREFLIREKKRFGDATLGKFTATFTEGSTISTISYSRQCCGATAYPTGTPSNISDGTFWMTCTQKGKVKANGSKGDDGHANVYLEKVNKSDNITVMGKFSPTHNINCK